MRARGLAIATTLLMMAAAIAAPAGAEVEKLMRVCDGGLCPSFRLLFKPPSGWIEDQQGGEANKVQMIVPRGKTFASADALIYVKVFTNRDTRSLAEYARVSQERWREAVKDTEIEPIAAQKRDNGKADFQLFRYRTPTRPQQEHEIVAFGEDSDKDGNAYFLVVVLTAAKRAAVDKAEGDYRAVLKAH